jgi:hypothetical protein
MTDHLKEFVAATKISLIHREALRHGVEGPRFVLRLGWRHGLGTCCPPQTLLRGEVWRVPRAGKREVVGVNVNE